MFKAIATPIAGLLAQVKLHARLASKEQESQSYAERLDEAKARLETYEVGKPRPSHGKLRTRLSGFAASPGFGIGRAPSVEERLGPGIVAVALPADDLANQVADRAVDLRLVDAKALGLRIPHDRTLVAQVAVLHRRALAVGLVGAEAHRPEQAGDAGRAVCGRSVAGNHATVNM